MKAASAAWDGLAGGCPGCPEAGGGSAVGGRHRWDGTGDQLSERADSGHLQTPESVENAVEERRGWRVEVAAEESHVSDRVWLRRAVSGLMGGHGSGLDGDRLENGFPYEGSQFFEGVGEFHGLLGAVAIAGNLVGGIVE